MTLKEEHIFASEFLIKKQERQIMHLAWIMNIFQHEVDSAAFNQR